MPHSLHLNLHGLSIQCTTSDSELAERWRLSFGAGPAAPAAALHFALARVPAVPAPPPGPPAFQQAEHLRYWVAGPDVVAYFPRYARLDLALESGQIRAALTEAALTTYGVFEDLVAIGLGPFLRRRGFFPVHAFAAAHAGRAVLVVGERGRGKTTTGISLLRAGWQLLSNDSPLLAQQAGGAVSVLRYPGLLSAYANTLARFPELAALVPPAQPPDRKLTFAAEAVYPAPWIDAAPAAVLCFPEIAHLAAHEPVPLSAADALRRLLPNSVDRWDTATLPPHFTMLAALTGQARAYQLRLGTNVLALPEVLEKLLAL